MIGKTLSRIIYGISTPKSITIATEERAYTATLGKSEIKIEDIQAKSKLAMFVARIPFLRIFSLGLLAPFALVFLFGMDYLLHQPIMKGPTANPYVVFGVLAIMIAEGIYGYRKSLRTRKNHGAEHMAIAALEADVPLTTDEVSKFETFSPNCGTITAFWIILSMPIMFLINSSTVVVLVGLELDHFVKNKDNKLFRFLQSLTTARPDEENLELAIRAAKALKEDAGVLEV